LNDDILVFGNNAYGQLGLGDYTNRSTPTQIPNIKAKCISAGRCYTSIIDLDVWL
jgi:alpha-tubulin suppressor-like RCC1 family protein